MIKANELRIGNWILLNNKPIEVYGTLMDYCGKQTEVPEFSPIPLTPEILQMASYGKYKFQFRNAGAVVLSDDGYDNQFYIHLEYLHQLQNLYFALTGEELKIEL